MPLDDDTRSKNHLEGAIYRREGTWTHWATGETSRYKQYPTTCGLLTLGHNFGSQALHLQARAQLPSAGWWGVQVGRARVEVNHLGRLRITDNGASVKETTLSLPGPRRHQAAAESSSVFVSEVTTSVPTRHNQKPASHCHSKPTCQQAPSPAPLESGLPVRLGSTASGSATAGGISHARPCKPQRAAAHGPSAECRALACNGMGSTGSGQPPTWKSATRDTRQQSISPDWTYHHIRRFPSEVGQSREITIKPIDVDCWLGRIFLCDSQGARIVHYADAEYLARWGDTATHDYGLQGVAIWPLGQGDVRYWERVAGATLPPETTIGYTS